MNLKTWLTPVTQRWSCTTIGIRPSYVAYMWICKLCRSKVFARLSLYEALRIAMTYAANVWISDLSLTIQYRGRRVIGISGSLIWSKTLMELIFNPCGEFRWSAEGPVSQIHSPHLHMCPWDLFRTFKVCSDTKEKVECGKQREATAPIHSLVKLQAWLSLRWKTCLRKNYSLGSCACSEGPALRQNTLMMLNNNQINK